MIRLSAFRWVAPFVQGLVRDLRVRWALEEAGIPHEERLVGRDDVSTAAYRALQPFGQVPAIETGELKLFESGAIVMYIAENSQALMPSDTNGRARTNTWIIAALNSVEPHVENLTELDLFFAQEEWAKARRPMALQMAQNRLAVLETWLGDREYLEGRFTAVDLMMTTVLRNLRHTNIIAERPVLDAYQRRCESRPAFKKALADHRKPFEKGAP